MNAVVSRVLCKCDAEEEGIDDALAGNEETALYLGVELRLHLKKLGCGLVLNVINAVFHSLVLDGGELLHLLVIECGKNCADALEGNVEILADLIVHGVCGNYKSALKSSRLCVIAGVDDRGVGLRSTATDVRVLFNNGNVELVLGKLTRECRSYGTCTNDDNVCLFHRVLLICF